MNAARFTSRAALSAAALSLLACSRAETEIDKIFEARTPRPGTSDSASPRARRHPPGENPFGLPSSALPIAAGDFVLAPSRAAVEQAFEQGTKEQTFVYYGATVEETGPLETRVRFATHERASLPNALVVPIRRAALANRGDVVLTSRASGAGLVRAIVVGGEALSPRVRYLDPPTPEVASVEDVLPRGTFHALREPGEPGSTLACDFEARTEPMIALRSFGDRRLNLGFAGTLRVLPLRACRPLPIAPALSAGQKVWFPELGGFLAGSVERVEAEAGRALVRFEFAGESRRVAVGITDLWVGPRAPSEP